MNPVKKYLFRNKIDFTPFDSTKIPPKQNLFFMPFLWLACWLATRRENLKIRKISMKGLKPPFLVLGTHHAFMDFLVTPLALFPYRANYVSELEGFEAYGEWLYRQAGCLGTRKFICDLHLVKNIKRVIERKGILVLYPEARYANVGTSSTLPDSIGKLAKMLQVPVVILQMHGNYLRSPIWNLTVRKEVKLEAEIIQLFTKEELEKVELIEINKKIQEYLTYDEYQWQYQKNIKITYPKRAEGLELVLYQCPQCNCEFKMNAEGADLCCNNCNSRWHMTELGTLKAVSKDTKCFSHIPDWYEWQRQQVAAQIEEGKYTLNTKVRIEALPNAVNFIDLGKGKLKQDKKGFTLILMEYGKNKKKSLFFSIYGMNSIHTEYNYRKKGQCITLSKSKNTYFLYPLEKNFNVTKIQFATEYFYKQTFLT